ncbi:MAG TPA: nucleotidyltransferase domain-containing protein [Thermoanaerobaculia bacterium]|nr:nucleotidyltransferase domain-containing protein [Thermoanaerobaculia bacterium]
MRRNAKGKKIDVEPYLEDLRRYLEDLDGLVAAWIYGSYGTPLQTPLSDLDLALLFRKEGVPDFKRQLEIYGKIPEILHEDDVSITILNRSPILFQFRVLETGSRLVCRDPVALADFVEWVISRHGDFIVDHQRFVAEYDQALVERYGR